VSNSKESGERRFTWSTDGREEAEYVTLLVLRVVRVVDVVPGRREQHTAQIGQLPVPLRLPDVRLPVAGRRWPDSGRVLTLTWPWARPRAP
jgi:hypothetical protein